MKVEVIHCCSGLHVTVLGTGAGSAMALGIEQGTPISELSVNLGIDPFFAINPVLLITSAGRLPLQLMLMSRVLWGIMLF